GTPATGGSRRTSPIIPRPSSTSTRRKTCSAWSASRPPTAPSGADMNDARHPFPASCLDPAEPGALHLDEARRRILQALGRPAPAVWAPLRSALGRLLAEDVRAPHDVPAS